MKKIDLFAKIVDTDATCENFYSNYNNAEWKNVFF